MIQKPRKWGVLVLFTCASTLLCCALPILLVSLGMGAVVASMASNLPWLVTLSQNKEWLFIISAICLATGGWALYRNGRSCPTDNKLTELCKKSHKWNLRLYWISFAIWIIGFFFAFIAVHLL